MKNLQPVEHFIGIPTRSNRLLLDHGRHNHISFPVNGPLKFNQIIKNKRRPTERAINAANNILEHVKLGSNISAIVKGKLGLGAKILKNGGVEKVFKHKFSVENREKILKASQCYISTTAGPIAGLLFITTNRIAFCSERSIKLQSPNGMSARAHYKISIPLEKIKGAIVSQNSERPSQKYIELATVDNFDFWFLGFLNYQNTYKYIIQAISLPQYFELSTH
ncbi:putative GEM-like protein 8 [Impatiens glandulifera]|uniref:putative GEM-like protein 8 n=1 Tax=Impatiens glandulifera TaxID=253017 RepID=UPI001FB18C66|nr:putative GEM-like protein 8 [Impatiens glandulifera]